MNGIDSKLLAKQYRAYIDCLNRQGWDDLDRFVAHDVSRNGRRLGLAGYREMLESDFRTIPDLLFSIETLVCEPPSVAARLWFECTPSGQFLGLDINGRRVSFAEHAIYEFSDGRISAVRSIIDKVCIEAQISD